MNRPEQDLDLLSQAKSLHTTSPSNFDERSTVQNCEKFVSFLLGAAIYCIPSVAVAEVVHLLRVAPLPNAPVSIAGIAAYRGEVIALVNIKEMLALEISAVTKKAKIIILRSNAKETQFALPVDSMHELITVTPDAITDDPSPSAAGMTRLLEYEGNIFKMIDPKILFERLEQSIN